MIILTTFFALSYSFLLVYGSFDLNEIQELQANSSSVFSIIPYDNSKVDSLSATHPDMDSVGITNQSIWKKYLRNRTITVSQFESITQKLARLNAYTFALEFVKIYSALYAASRNALLKSFYLKAVLKADNVDQLIDLLTYDPEMLSYVFIINNSEISFSRSIVVIAVESKAIKCLHFFLKVFPELATATCMNGHKCKFMTLIKAVVMTHSHCVYCPIIEQYGFGAEFVIDCEGQKLNLLQCAFYGRVLNSLKYYVEQVGEIRARYLIRKVMNMSNDQLISYITHSSSDLNFNDYVINLIQSPLCIKSIGQRAAARKFLSP